MEKTTSHSWNAAREQAEETIGLQQGAKELQRKKKEVDPDRMLTLLRSGELIAGFQLRKPISIWIDIPKSHWSKVKRAKFQHDWDKGYCVTVSEVASAVAAAWMQKVEDPREYKQLARLLKASNKKLEVEISRKSWDSYLQNNPSRPSGPPETDEKVSWHDTIPFIVEYFVRNNIKGDDKITSVAAGVSAALSQANLNREPGHEYLKDIVGRCLKRLRKPQNRA